MNYKHHLEACAVVAIFITLLGLTRGMFSKDVIIELWTGFIPYATIITCDLDSDTSTVTKLWGPFKIIWHPFVEAGHREILHHWFWGPFNLVGFWLMPALYLGVDVSGWTVAGAVLMLWCHMAVDVSYSGVKRVLPKWIWKRIEKVI